MIQPPPQGGAAGHAALLVVQLCFGLFPLFILWAVEGFSPEAIVVWRILVGALVFGGVAFAVHGRAVVPPRRDLLRVLVGATLAIPINMVLAIEGMSRSTSTEAGLIMTLIPVFTVAIATAVGQERLSGRRMAGIGLAMCGALVLLLAHGGGGLRGEHFLGNLMMAGNCLSYAAFLVLARPLLARHPPLVVVAWVYVFSVWSLPFIAHGEELWPGALSSHALAGLGYTLLFPTLIAYFLNTFALARVSASKTAIYIYLQPLIAGAAGIAFLGERATAWILVAGTLLFAGIGLVSFPRPAASARTPLRSSR